MSTPAATSARSPRHENPTSRPNSDLHLGRGVSGQVGTGGAVGAHGNRQAAEHGRTRTDSAHISEEAHHGDHHEEGGSFGSLLQGLAGAHAEGPQNGSGHAAAGTPHGEAAAPEAHPRQNGPQGAHAPGSVPANGAQPTDTHALAERLQHDTETAMIRAFETPQTRQLVDRMNSLRDRLPGRPTPQNPHPSAPHLRFAEEMAVHRLDGDRQRMYGATLNQLEALRDGRIDNVDYMGNVMQSAADIAGNDREQFVRLAHFAMNANVNQDENGAPSDTGQDQLDGRRRLGGGFDLAGSTLDLTQYRILQANPHYQSRAINSNRMLPDLQMGFDRHVMEPHMDPRVSHNDINRSNTMTHHPVEFMLMGYNRGPQWAGFLQDLHDRPDRNPGDNSSGHFAAMVGDALHHDQITNQEAVNLFRRSFSSGESTMWPDTQVASDRNWNIQDWMQEYRTHRPTHEHADRIGALPIPFAYAPNGLM